MGEQPGGDVTRVRTVVVAGSLLAAGGVGSGATTASVNDGSATGAATRLHARVSTLPRSTGPEILPHKTGVVRMPRVWPRPSGPVAMPRVRASGPGPVPMPRVEPHATELPAIPSRPTPLPAVPNRR